MKIERDITSIERSSSLFQKSETNLENSVNLFQMRNVIFQIIQFDKLRCTKQAVQDNIYLPDAFQQQLTDTPVHSYTHIALTITIPASASKWNSQISHCLPF
ncbi:hypothetical protein D917_00843 [Trichinella nativa]|uniref:Uncharacterized protein n=1 Tax=Trichinella nativa TaxID=6335 RepID=A0A1Y3E3T2_9BILA|nr:hypothetical protein D917_00843 [Trichinella nativa]